MLPFFSFFFPWLVWRWVCGVVSDSRGTCPPLPLEQSVRCLEVPGITQLKRQSSLATTLQPSSKGAPETPAPCACIYSQKRPGDCGGGVGWDDIVEKNKSDLAAFSVGKINVTESRTLVTELASGQARLS